MVVNKRAIVVLAIAGSIFLAWRFATSNRAPDLRPLDKTDRILAFGDSITEGYGVEPNESYPYLLQMMIDRTVINSGVSGELSLQGLQRLPSVIDEHKPSLVILCHGGNDFLLRTGKERAAKNIETMVEAMKERGIDVVIIGVPEPGLLLSSADFYKPIAEKHQVPYEGDVLADIISDPSLKSDQIHPNAAGNRVLAISISALLQDAGAI